MIKVKYYTSYNPNFTSKFSNYEDLNNSEYYCDVKTIHCSGGGDKFIRPLLPKYLVSFNWTYGKLESLQDRLPDTLEFLNCLSNRLTKIPILPNKLTKLSIMCNHVTELPELPDTLVWLNCNDNKLTKLPILPPLLRNLFCNGNQITSLPELPSTLRRILCADNEITALPKLPDSLIDLCCSKNNITEIEKHRIYMDTTEVSCIFDNNPIYEYIHDYFDSDVMRYFDFIEAYEQRFANKISQWYLDCKYNPKYKICRDRIEEEYEELYNQN